MKKKHIKITDTSDFQLIGIVTAEKQHRLAWLLNNNLLLKLVQASEIATEKNNRLVTFPVYECYDEKKQTNFRLIANKAEMQTLVAKQKDFDYLLAFTSAFFETEQLISQLRQFEFIVAAYSIEKEKISGKHQKLLF